MPIFRNASLLSRRAVDVRVAVGTAMVASMLVTIASPASAALAGGASGGNGSQTHVGTVVGGNPTPCSEFRSFEGVTRFRGGDFSNPAFTAVTTDVTVTAGPSTSVIYYAGPYGTYPVSSTPCSGSPAAVPGFRITVRAVNASGSVLTCTGIGTFLRNGVPAVNATFDFPGSTCGPGTMGRITLTARTVQPCVIAPTPATCAYEPNSATLSFDGTPPPTTQPPWTPEQETQGVGNCTSGFTLYSATSNKYYGTTAGHCGETGDQVLVGTRQVSPIGVNTFFADAAACTGSGGVPCIDADASSFLIQPADKTGRINTGAGGHRSVRGQLSNADLNIYPANKNLCFQGAVSGADNCGRLVVRDEPTFSNPAPGDGDGDGGRRYLRHSWCIDARGPGELPDGAEAVLQPDGEPEIQNDGVGPNSDPGDSGGPFYQVDLTDQSAKAAGLLHGRAIATDEARRPYVITCFSSIENVQSGLSATLVTG